MKISFVSLVLFFSLNDLSSQEYTIGIPQVEYTEIQDYYFVGQEVQCTARVYSYGLVDDLCAIYYEIFKDDFSSPVVNLTQYGNAKFTIRSQGTNYVTQEITQGNGYFSTQALWTTYIAFTLGIFDNWCTSRNRPVALSMTFTEPGLYKFNAEIQKCSNSGSSVFTSFTSNGNEGCGEAGTSHADKVASTCTSPQTLFSDEIIIPVCDENQITFIEGETEYCPGDELFLTYAIGNNDDEIDEFLLPEWVNVDIDMDTKIASLSGIIPDYDEENSIIEFEVKSISSYNPIACPGASINQYITIKPSHLKTLNIEICEGESYEFAGSIYTESTNTSYSYINDFACDSIVNLNLIVYPTYTETISIGICDNEVYEFAGVELNETGEYSHTFESINGCDSIVNLNLLVYPTYTETLNVEICEGEYYEFAGQNLSESGEYSHSFESIFACDSIVNLNLTLNPITITNLYEEICEGDTYFFNNEELSEAGEYQMLIENIYACNDITNLNLEVNPNYNIILNKQICEGDSYEFDGITYLENTNITKTFTSFYGCDSIINLNLEFVELFEINLNESICEGEVYEFAGEELNETGEYSHIFESIFACDSIVNLNLTVYPTYNQNLNIEICEGEVYEFAGEDLIETGEYSHIFESIYACDSIVNLNLTVYPT